MDKDFKEIVKEKLKQFIYALCNGTRRQLYMSGACDCSEFRHGTDNIGDSYDPDHYYLTRSFEQIKNININGQVVNVEYEGIVKTQNEDFE